MFSEKIFELRKKRGITQREVADAVGITAASISAYEKGAKIPPLDTAIAVAKYFGVSLDYLCGLQDGDAIKGQNDLTRADVLRMLSAIREHVDRIFVENKVTAGGDPKNNGGIVFITKISLYSKTDWALNYFEKYDALVKLYKGGDIDAEVLEAWKEKKLNSDEYLKPVNCDETLLEKYEIPLEEDLT